MDLDLDLDLSTVRLEPTAIAVGRDGIGGAVSDGSENVPDGHIDAEDYDVKGDEPGRGVVDMLAQKTMMKKVMNLGGEVWTCWHRRL